MVPLLCVMQVASIVPRDMLRLMQERRFYSVDEMAGMTPAQRAAVIDAATCHSWDEVPEPLRSEVLSTARELAQRFRDAH